MTGSRSQISRQGGMASMAVLVFSVVAILILVANFNLNYGAVQSGAAFDIVNSQLVEKNGLAQIVKESVLAVGETAATVSANSLQTEIQNRLNGMTFPAGVTVALASSAAALPSNLFFPSGTPAAVETPAYFSTSPRGVAGMGNLFTSFVSLGPAADLGTLAFTFSRSSANSPADNRTYTVDANLFSMPLTNVDVIAYGLPASGSIPASAPAVPAGFFASGVSSLVVTSNNPANDPTACPDLFTPVGAEKLPYQFRNAVSVAWNAYEFLWSYGYQDALLGAAEAAGTSYDFSAAQNPAIPGVTANANSLTIDCSAVQGLILSVVDSEGIGSVTILGSAASGSPPFVLLIRNTAGTLHQTAVTFSGSNNRPAIFYLENTSATFSGNPQIQGALFLDPTSVASGNVTWFGHFSFYALNSPLPGLGITLSDSPAVKAALAPLAPRVLLVSTTSTR